MCALPPPSPSASWTPGLTAAAPGRSHAEPARVPPPSPPSTVHLKERKQKMSLFAPPRRFDMFCIVQFKCFGTCHESMHRHAN